MFDGFFNVLLPGLGLCIVLLIIGFLVILFMVLVHLLMIWFERRVDKLYDYEPSSTDISVNQALTRLDHTPTALGVDKNIREDGAEDE